MTRAYTSALALLSLTACVASTGTTSAPPPAVAAPGAGASSPSVPGSCGALITGGPVSQRPLGGARVGRQEGARLELASPKRGERLVLGVLGPINEDSDGNLAALARYRTRFLAEKVDAIVVTGDVGEDACRVKRALAELAVSQLPVLVVPGNTESQKDFADGVSQAAARFPNVVDLSQVRTVRFPQLALVSLPGYYDPVYVKSKDTCVYGAAAVEEVVAEARRQEGPVALVSHGPPRGEGPDAIDWARTIGTNAGDPAVTAAIAQAGIRFGFFSNIKEAGGRGTADVAGSRLVKEGEPSPTLFLNPGPADTSPWEMNDRTKSLGMAAVFTLENDRASYRLIRLAPATAADRAAARASAVERACE